MAHVLNGPGRGGVPRVVHGLVRHTDPDRFVPHVFYLKGGDGPDPFTGMDIPRRTARTGSKAAAMTELVAFLDRHRIDILHTHSFRPNLYARIAGAVLRPAGLRIVAHYHNDYGDKWGDEALLLERRLAAVTDAGLAVSASVAGTVGERVGLACEVAANGIDRDRTTGGCRAGGRAALGVTEDAFTVGLVGRVCHQKGVDTFVDAAQRCLAKGQDMQFRVIGDPEDPTLLADLTARAGRHGMGDRIRFAGHQENIADVLAALDLLVAPSRWEGFGLMLSEAMAAGVPVLASDVGGIPEVIGNAGRLIPADDPNALSKAIVELASDPRERRSMVAKGLVQAERFDWARTAEKVATVYDRIGGRR